MKENEVRLLSALNAFDQSIQQGKATIIDSNGRIAGEGVFALSLIVDYQSLEQKLREGGRLIMNAGDVAGAVRAGVIPENIAEQIANIVNPEGKNQIVII